MLHIVLVEGVVVGKPVRELDVDGRITGLHQLQIDKQSPGTAITVDEGIDAFKFDVEPGQFRYDVFGALHVARHQLFHPGLDQIGLHRLMLCSHDTDGDPAVHTPVILLVRQWICWITRSDRGSWFCTNSRTKSKASLWPTASM